jgi:hypothetical protein
LGKLEKVLKYKTAYLFSVAMGQAEMPEPVLLIDGDRPDYLFGGGLGHSVKQRIASGAGKRKSVRLAYDLYCAKRGSLPVDERFIESALDKHFKLITTEQTALLEAPILDVLIHEVRRTAIEACKGYSGKKIDGKCPTFGSCVQNPRGKGGAFGYLCAGVGLTPAEGYLYKYMRYRTQVVEVRVPDDGWEDYQALLGTVARNDKNLIPCCPVALCEPFKVRVITRGCAVKYHLARQYQPRLHRSLARNHPFRLTMGPASVEHIQELLDKTHQFDHPENGFWVSGDYEAATDNFIPLLSNEAIDAMCGALKVPIEDWKILSDTLSGHLLEWSGRFEDREAAEQKWGQLMGSPTSFPVLCLVNAAVNRYFLEQETGRVIPLRSCPMLINGDDVLFWMPKMESYERWKALVSSAGLKPSIGKNYVSQKFLVINSEIFEVTKKLDYFGQWNWQCIGSVPTLNLGLLYGDVQKSSSSHGMEKTLFGSHEMQRDSFRQRAIDWVAGYPEKEDEMVSLFVRYNKEFLSRLPTGMSWWIHPRYGGIGLPVTRKVVITERQRKLAAMLHCVSDPVERKKLLPSLRMPLPAFVDEMMGYTARLLKRVGAKFESGGEYTDESTWRILPGFFQLGIDPTDPEGMSAFVKGFQRAWKKSARHWAKPLSFHNCVGGPREEMGLVSKIYWS